jgi:hypothetical protein
MLTGWSEDDIMLEILNIRRRMRTYADVCGRMLTGRSEDDIMLEILNIRRRMRTYADRAERGRHYARNHHLYRHLRIRRQVCPHFRQLPVSTGTAYGSIRHI